MDQKGMIDAWKQGMTYVTDYMQRSEKASKGIAENLTEFATQLRSGHHSFKDYLGSVIKLPPILKEISGALTTQQSTMIASIRSYQDQREAAKEALIAIRAEMNELRKNKGSQERLHELKEQQKSQSENGKIAKAAIALEQKRLTLKQSIALFTGEELASEFILISALSTAVKQSGAINNALMQANSLTSTRQILTQQIYEVQATTGASMDNMLGAAKALTAVWPKTRSDFQSTLETVVMMEEGLGVSFDNASQLARVFQVTLKVPVREIADQIAVIANSTTLAADEATRFATEIGKALRLLGPGGASQIKEVTGYVTMLAARMQDVGGDAGDIVKLFSEMTKGTQQGFMLRGLSGVNNPAALGTQGGAQAAMQGLSRMIDRIVSARPGTQAYVAQLDAASQILGTSTDNIILFKKALEAANQPLDEHAKLEKRWQEQVQNANKSLQRLEESFLALIHRVLLPVIPVISAILNGLSRFVSMLASSRIAIITTAVIITAAAVRTAYSLAKLGAALVEVALASEFAAKVQGVSGSAGSGGGIGGILTQIFGKPGAFLATIRTSLSSPALWTNIGRILGQGLMRFGPFALIAGATYGSYKAWQLFDRAFPGNWIALLAQATGHAYSVAFDKHPYGSVTGLNGKQGKPAAVLMNEIRQELLRGHTENALRIFESGKKTIPGLHGEKGAKAYVEMFAETFTAAREKIAQNTPSVNQKEAAAHDKELITLQKKTVENSAEFIRQSKINEQNESGRYQATTTEESIQRMINNSSFRLMSVNNVPSKLNLSGLR